MAEVSGQPSLFEQDEQPKHPNRERFLTGLLATWLAGPDAKPTKAQVEKAREAAALALRSLHS